MEFITVRDRSSLPDRPIATPPKAVPFPELAKFPQVKSEFSSVIFDFDGTLANSMWVWDDVDRAFSETYGLTLPDTYLDEIASLSFVETAVFFRDELGVNMSVDEICHAFNDLAYERYAQHVPCKDGVKGYLELLRARGVSMAIATSLSWTLLEASLERNGIAGYFEDIAFCDECGHGKSRPDVYLLAAERIGAKPEECLVFEDIVPGARSAKSVGMTVGAILDNPAFEAGLREAADFCIADFRELLPS